MNRTVDVVVQEIKDTKGPRDNEWYLGDSLEFAEYCMKQQGHIAPMVVGILADGTRLAFTLPGISPNKDESLCGASILLKKLKCERYLTVMEGWYLEGQGDLPDIRPSQSERRKEGITVSVCDDTGVLAFGMKEIVRDDSGKFLELKEIPDLEKHTKSEGSTFGGAFTELLQD